jgi:uncharacterized protein (DUF885 family)
MPEKNLDKKLDNLSKEFFEYLLKFHPPSATLSGIHDYDEEMPEGTPESIEEFHRKRKTFYEQVKSIDPEQLSFNGKIDREALLNSFGIDIFLDETCERWRSHSLFSTEVAGAIHLLFTKEFAPLEERMSLIAARMEKSSRFLENRKKILTDPIDIWVMMGIRECQNSIDFINIVRESGIKSGINEKLQHRLNTAAETVIKTLKETAHWLETEKLPRARSDYYIKPEDFEKFIEMRNLGMSTEQMLQFANDMLPEYRQLQQDLVNTHAPGLTIEQYSEMIKKIGPATFEEALEKTREAVENSRQFVIDNKFATIPDDENLTVMETPDFLKSLVPFGAYMPPGKFDKKQVGVYWLSPPPAGRISTDGALENSHLGAILNTSIHEGYPGHHLQFICANTNKSYSRLLAIGAEFIEGWAHYCEEMVSLMGFSKEPEVMFERYNDMIWRAVRIIVDIKLSRGEMNIDQAVDFLHQETGFGRVLCNAEVERYTLTPGYPLSYLIGKKRILEILNSVMEQAGSSFDMKKFHDSMLYAGSLPIAIMEKVVKHEFGLEIEALV